MTYQSTRTSIAVFDYRHSLGSERRLEQTVIFVQSPDLRLPKFSVEGVHPLIERLYGEGSTIKEIATQGKESRLDPEVVLDKYPQFRELYRLRGEDPEAIRSLFSDRVVAFLEGIHPLSGLPEEQMRTSQALNHQKLGLVIEGVGDQTIMFYPSKRLSADAVRETLDRCQWLLALIRKEK
jgi:hypothetical protein